MTLILSLPPVHQSERLESIINHPGVGAVRYNTGVSSAYEPEETVRQIQVVANKASKPVYIDLKGKQLRVTEWANLPEGPIVLNHRIKVELPAKVYFRGDDCCELRATAHDRELYVDPLPKSPVGRGQAVNIIAKSLTIEGGLLELDHEYIKAAVVAGITRFMLSFVESWADVQELEEAIEHHNRRSKLLREYEIVLKIESQKGIDFVASLNKKHFRRSPYRLMAARDDLMIQIGVHRMPAALAAISRKDPNAICASRLLLGLETGGVSLADLSDLEYMRLLGYQHFMLSDTISREHSDEALTFWEAYRQNQKF